MKREDDFAPDTKQLLAERVGKKCSNPNCRKSTSGPSSDPKKTINIGVAAHITAAAAGGPRYDSTLSPFERRSPDNGVWCCQNCAKLIDNDPDRYTVDLLTYWKTSSEEAARREIEMPSQTPLDGQPDAELIRFYAQCIDRPAFQDPFQQEGSMESFDKAIEDTITAINTGCLRSRDGQVLAQSKGKAYLQNPDWRGQMDTIVELLRAIRSRYELGKRLGLISSDDKFYCVRDPHTADWMDSTREEALKIFAEISEQAGLRPLRSNFRPPRHRPHW